VTTKPCSLAVWPLLDEAFAHDVVLVALATTRQYAGRVATMELAPQMVDLDGPRPLGCLLGQALVCGHLCNSKRR
jgi:hypothetical protein